MATNILLVNAPVYDFAAYDLFSKPLGLLYLGAFLRQMGYGVRLLDAMDRHHPAWNTQPNLQLPKVRPNGTGKYYNQIVDKPACLKHIPRNYRRYGMPADMLRTQLACEYEQYHPTAVFVSSIMTYWYPGVAEMIKLIRQTMPRVPIALGGIYARLMPQHSLHICKPDVVFTSTGFSDVLRWLKNISTTSSNNKTPNRIALQDDFAHWPIPAYDLYQHLNYITVITSLGCPFHCDYCASSFLQKRMQHLTADVFTLQLDKMLEILQNRLPIARHLDPNNHSPAASNSGSAEYNHLLADSLYDNATPAANKPLPYKPAYNIAFMDDALLVNAHQRLIPILKNLIKRSETSHKKLHIYCPNGLHVRFITTPIAELMYAAGFKMIRLSYEAADAAARWQQASDNKVNDLAFRQAVKRLINAGFKPQQLEAYVLTALPGQTIHEMTSSVQIVHDMGLKVRLCQYCPIPHTKMFASACKLCNIDPDEPLLHNNSVLPCLDNTITYQHYQQFRNYVNQLNQKL